MGASDFEFKHRFWIFGALFWVAFTTYWVGDQNAGAALPNWTDGFLGEAFMWTMAASVAGFALTLKQMVFFVLLAMAFVVYAMCYAIILKRRKAGTPAA